MTLQQILERVNGLSQGNDIVEVYIWDKASFAVTMLGPKELQDRLDQLSRTEDVLGAIHYSGLVAPGPEDFTTDGQGLKQFQILLHSSG